MTQRVFTADQWRAAAAEAKSDPSALEKWTEQVDEMVDTYLQVRQQQSLAAALKSWLAPQHLAMHVHGEWVKLVAENP